MKTNETLAQAVRLAIGGAIGLSAAIAGPAAWAQQASDQKIEEIVITGSRIAQSTDFEAISPVISVDKDDIAKSGYQNLQQLLIQLPATGNGTFSTRGNNQDSTANGTAAVSLRGLGADATLVLVNGRRVAISSFAQEVTTNFVDINSIPMSAIERVEVLKDGASAVYGSDAVAGVVNIILRDNFEGLELTGSIGSTTEGDLSETNVSALWGTGGDKGNVTLILDYFKNDTLYNTDRGPLGSADQSARGGEDFRSSRGFPGYFVVDGVATIDPGCPADQAFPPACVYDYGPWNLLTPESERVGLMVLGNYSITSDLELFTEIAVQHNRSVAQGAPTPLDEDADLSVPVSHPDNPYVGATTIDVGRFRTVDAGPRQWDIQSDNLRMVLGLRGTVSDWDWEVSAQRGRSESDQTGDRTQGWVRTDFLQQEINAGRYNPFGGTYNSPDVIDDITTSLVRRGTSNLTAYDATVWGDLFDMSAGPVRMAAGLEYREESISDVPDDQFQRGLIFGTESVSAAGSRDIWSAFVEFSVPLLDSLELQLAGRYDDYSDFGDTTNPKLGLRWQPLDTLAFRASWGTGFRAPSLAQVGLGPSQESRFFSDTYGCAENVAYCAATDYTLVFAGNPNLDAEESESWNLGIGWEPMDNLSLTLDYWDIKQENKIDEAPFQFLYDTFCNDQDSLICVRNPALPGDTLGPLSRINTGFINIGEQAVSGIDLSASYLTDVGGGALGLTFFYSYLMSFDRTELDGSGTAFVTRDLSGKYEYPEHRWTMSGDWTSGDWGLYAALNYVGEFEDLGGTLNYDADWRTVSSFMTLNLQVRYTGIEKTAISLGVDNALNEKPPFAIGDGDTDLYGFVSSQHDPRGAYVYGKVTYSF